MVWKRAAGAMVMGCLMAGGCMQHERQTPPASATIPPMDPAAVASLEQSWRETHPGSLVGHVNAVDPERHVLQVTGLPLDKVHDGDVISILLNGQANSVVPAKVFDTRDGFVQMDYGPLQAGQSDPRDGDLAIWFSAGLTPNEESATIAGVNTAPAATQPAGTTPEMPATTPPPAGTPTPPPAETPASPSNGTAAPTTTPAAPAPTESNPPAATPAPAPAPGAGAGTPPPPAPDNKVPADLNK